MKPLGGNMMAKRKITGSSGKYKKKADPSHNLHGEIAALLVISLGLLMAVSFFSNAAGVFGDSFKKICMGLLGYFVYVIPFVIIAYGIHYMIRKEHFNCGYKYGFGLGLLVVCSAIAHIFYYRPENKMNIGESFAYFYRLGEDGKGGGFIGGVIAEPIINMFGPWGAGIILGTCVLVFIMLITHLSIAKVFTWIYRMVKKGMGLLFRNVVAACRNIKEDIRRHDLETEDLDEEDLIPIQQFAGQDEAAATEEAIEVFDHQAEHHVQKRGHETNSVFSSESKPSQRDEEKDAPQELAAIGAVNEHIEYTFPSIDLLMKSEQNGAQKNSATQLRNNAKKLADTLKSFGVEAKVLQVSRGPSITRYELQPSTGVKVSKIVNLADDIALNLAASGVRIEAPIPGKAAIGIEVPNKEVTPVYLREVLESEEFVQFPSKLAFSLGKDIAGKPVVADIARMPHLLIAGATGSGKSVCINTLITSILYKANPNEVKLVLIDPKVVELGVYNGIPHLLIPVVTDPKKAASALNWAVQEMVRRYKLFAENNVRDLKGYNVLMQERQEVKIENEEDDNSMLPQIVIIIDELADLMMVAPNDVENAICRLAQMARAAGMHLVIATQRPSVDVITGVIKANIPSRISFAVSSQVDSRTILDMAGAEKLLGKGDMLFYPVGAAKPTRLQGAFISDKEVENIVQFVKESSGASYHEDVIEHIEQDNGPGEINEGDNDELLPQAIELVVESGQASISMLQRRMRVGYARAARLIDQMEARGIVGGHEGSKPRQVLITKEQYHEMIMHEER